MQFRLLIICLTLPLLFVSFILGSTGAQEKAAIQPAPALSPAEGTLDSAIDLLKPPDTSSPRETLKSFLDNMNRSYGILMSAHRKNLKSEGWFTSKPVKQMARDAREFFQSGVDCLNLDKVPRALKKQAGFEGAIMLKEVLDRIGLPPFDQIPDAHAIDAEEGGDEITQLSRWRIPNTEIVIDRVEEGPRKGEFLFTSGTVARIEEFYGKVKGFPYKPNTLISHGFYDFYTSTPGRLLPPKWSRWLPAWTNETYLDQTLWQWCALVVLPLVVFLIVWLLVRFWYRRAAELATGKRSAGWLGIVMLTILMVSTIKYLLDVHVNITGLVRIFMETTFQRIFILLLAGLILWEFLKARIRDNMEEEQPQPGDQGEEGGAGGSRSETLLLLLRKTIMFVLFVIVCLLLLASMGINIGPLLAGAGVIGLAIGFGAQTLVRDIFSGIFFLVDDAFRVGDYIETAGTKGTVEHISLRSLRLRHPRGMVHTIPFGDMGIVTNLSRDYIITKLDIRVRYDANIKKIKKIIKKINKKISQDEELSLGLLDKIKSQGVRQMDDSAMIVRVKYKTIPGAQFVLRREIYRMIQEDFTANNIEFAHRNVTVYMPPEQASDVSKKKVVEAAAAAAMATQPDEEEKK